MNKYIRKCLYPLLKIHNIHYDTKGKKGGAGIGAERHQIMMQAHNSERREGQKENCIRNVPDHSTVLGKSGVGCSGVPKAKIAHERNPALCRDGLILTTSSFMITG